MDFACNPAGPTAALEMLTALDTERAAPRWLLVDVALLDAKRLRALISLLGWELFNAFQGSTLEVFGSQAPHLVALPGNMNVAATGLQRLIEINKQAPAFSVIESSSTRADLFRLCAYLAQARVDGDMLVHCRFADTRVLPHLLRALSLPQVSRVSVDVHTWSWKDHLAETIAWRRSSGEASAPTADAAAHLELDNRQFAAMLDASEPDTMFWLLLDNTQELVPVENRGSFRDRLSRILARADMRRLNSPNDRLQFAILSLGYGDAFHEQPALQSTWGAIEQRGATLVDEMKTWSDELWEQLQNRRTAVTK